jgi:hypothetical protein
MADQLPGARPVRRKTHTIDDIIEPGLHDLKKNLTRNAFFPCSLMETVSELPLQQTITVAHLLFFSELHAIIGELATPLPVLSGRVLPPLDSTLFCKTTIAFQEQFFCLPAA